MSNDETAGREVERTACPCGWFIPRNITVEGVLSTGTVLLTFDCPKCGRRLQMGAEDEAPSEGFKS